MNAVRINFKDKKGVGFICLEVGDNLREFIVESVPPSAVITSIQGGMK
jgi:hypothetical protein